MAKLFQLDTKPLDADAKAERLYQEYPRHVGKGAALTAIRKAMKTTPFDELVESVVEYAKACKQARRERHLIPYPATWFNQERWKDDRADWYAGAADAECEELYTRLLAFVRKHGRRASPTGNGVDEFNKAKRIAKLCGWDAFCDGKVGLKQFKAAWRENA